MTDWEGYAQLWNHVFCIACAQMLLPLVSSVNAKVICLVINLDNHIGAVDDLPVSAQNTFLL